LKVDLARTHLPKTGVPVRALRSDGEWGAVDIAHLDRQSLWNWMEGLTARALMRLVEILLGHDDG
jgi:hypothetical protein